MADKVDKKLASALPVAVENMTKKKAPPPFPAVQLVCLWALLTAGIFVGSGVLAYALNQHEINLPSWMVPRAGSLTGAAAAVASAIGYGELWFRATQAGAAAVVLLLPALRHRSRRALAYVALAAAATGHLMFARCIALFLAANPGCVFFWIGGAVSVFLLAAGDIICFLALLLLVPSDSEDRSYSVRELHGSAIQLIISYI